MRKPLRKWKMIVKLCNESENQNEDANIEEDETNEGERVGLLDAQ